MEKPNCYKCKHRGSVPGSTHSSCKHPGNSVSGGGIFDYFINIKSNFENADKLNITADRHGVEMGWFFWPADFDPVWLLNCDGFDPV